MPKRRLEGLVTSTAMKDTVTVEVESRKMHPKYRKFIKRSSKYHAHDEGNKCKVGNRVVIEECRPMSKTKTWIVVESKEG